MSKPEAAVLIDRLSDVAGSPDAVWPSGFAAAARDWDALLSEAFAAGAGDIESTPAEMAAYVEGRLEDAKIEAFEARLAASPALREEVDDLRDRVGALDPTLAAPPRRGAQDSASAATVAGLRAAFLAGVPLSAEQQRALFTDVALRADYNRLIRVERLRAPPAPVRLRFAPVLAMPARIAASSDKIVQDRSFPGGTSHIGSAGRPNLLQVRIRIDGLLGPFDTLELRGPDGAIGYLSLPAPNLEGEITRIVDLNVAEDAEAIGLLRDPLSTGEFRSILDAAPSA